MKRAILVPAALVPDALDELKSWLSISTPQEDALLSLLLGSALEMCEAFTRQMPLEVQCEEIFAASTAWQLLATHPVQAVTGAESVLDDGTRVALGAGEYEIELTDDGGACFRLLSMIEPSRVAVQFTAGLASSWTSLPSSLRQGIIRLAAFLYRQRDVQGAPATPPASIAALWRPWRRLRLA